MPERSTRFEAFLQPRRGHSLWTTRNASPRGRRQAEQARSGASSCSWTCRRQSTQSCLIHIRQWGRRCSVLVHFSFDGAVRELLRFVAEDRLLQRALIHINKHQHNTNSLTKLLGKPCSSRRSRLQYVLLQQLLDLVVLLAVNGVHHCLCLTGMMTAQWSGHKRSLTKHRSSWRRS